MPPQSAKAKARSEFLGRLSYYMIGISIGLVLLGLWQMQKRSLVAREQAAFERDKEAVIKQQAAEVEARLHRPPPTPAPDAASTAAPK